MSLIWDRLFYWNEELEMFKVVNKEWIDLRINKISSHAWGKIFGIDEKNGIIYFSPSRQNPKEPATLDINWNVLLLQHESHFWYALIGKERAKINLKKSHEISGRLFYEVDNNGMDEKYFTDWEKIFSFKIDEKWKILCHEYQGKKYPLMNISEKHSITRQFSPCKDENSYLKVYYYWNWKPEILFFVKNEQEKTKKDALKNVSDTNPEVSYLKLSFTPEQEKLALIFTDQTNWIVCLWGDWWNNTSRYQFYRINKDWSLSFVFINRYNIDISWNEVVIKDKWNRNNGEYRLIRRPNTTSIFEPIIINEIEYLIAKWKKPWELVYITIEEKSGIYEEMFEIDPKTFLPTRSFIFDNETLYYTSKWEIKIGNNTYILSDSKGNTVKSPEQAVYKVWEKQLLILKWLHTFGGDNQIFAYFAWFKIKDEDELTEINHLKKNSNHSFSSALVVEIKKIEVSWKEYICRYDFKVNHALWILEFEDKALFRYVNRKVNKWKLVWEEFECDWKKVIITNVISSEYLEGENSNTVYFRENNGKNLVALNFPDKVLFGSGPYCQVNDRDYALMMKKWKLVSISDEFKDFYKLDDDPFGDIKVNWKKIRLIHVWDSKANSIVAFEKTKNIPFTFWWSSISKVFNGLYIMNQNGWKYLKLNSDNINLVKILNNGNHWTILEKVEWQKDLRWRKIFDMGTFSEEYHAIYEIGSETIAVNLKLFTISISSSWQIILNGIAYDKNIIDSIYEEFRPKGSINEVIWHISKKVEWLSK